MLLTENQLDLLKELLNIGIGKSSATLHELVNLPIKLSVPEVQLYLFEDFNKMLEAQKEDKFLSVKMEFHGKFSGLSQIVFPVESAQNLVYILTGVDNPAAEFDELMTGTLSEVANMLLNGVIGTMGNLLSDHFEYSIPIYQEDTWNGFLRNNMTGSSFILYGNSHFEVSDKDIKGDIILIFEMPSLLTLIQTLDNMLGEM